MAAEASRPTATAPGASWAEDLALALRVEQRLTALETILPTLATKTDIAEVRAEIHKGIVETQRWMIATIIGLFIGFGGLFLAMSNLLRPVAISWPATLAPPASAGPAVPGTAQPPAPR